MIKIGIDPAFRKNGFCMCIVDEQKEVRFVTFKRFIDFIGFVQNELPENCIVAVENSNLQNTTFDMSGSRDVLARKSRNVGLNQAVSEITCQLLRQYATKVIEVSPKQKGAKWMHPLVIGFIKSMGYKCSKKVFTQDERDALSLIRFCK